jgi:hypothetical protein
MAVVDHNRTDELARALLAQAARVSELQTTLRSSAAAARWDSPAASAFSETMQVLLKQLGSCATMLSDSSLAVQRHGVRSANRAREIATLTAQASRLVGDALKVADAFKGVL